MEIKEFNKENSSFQEIIDLFKIPFGSTDYNFWKWKHCSDTSFDETMIIVAVENSKIVGMMGFMPCDYYDDKGEYKLIQTSDLVVHPNYRGKGLFYKIYQYAEKKLFDKGFDCLFAYPNDNSYHGFVKLDYKLCCEMYSYYVINNIYYIIKKFLRINIKRRLINKQFSIKESDVELFSNIADFSFDEIRWISGNRIKLKKTPLYFSWKYDQRPDIKHKYYYVFNADNIVAYFVVRFTTGKRFTAGKIVDWDIDSAYSLDFKKIALLVKNKLYESVDMIDFYGNWGEDVEQMMIKAFKLINKKKHFLFRNTLTKDNPYLIKAIDLKQYLLSKEWFLNYGDTDL